MANFRVYNVQLLPNSAAAGDVGVVGYKRLFAAFRNATRDARVQKRLLAYHRDVGRDAHFGPETFNVAAGYVWGHFVRYKRTDRVDDLNTGKRLFKEGAKQVGVASRTELMFVFDCKQHFFAIEEAGASLPPPLEFLAILQEYLEPLRAKIFPDHSLHILLIADKSSLDGVLSSAVAYSKIEVDLTFPNGPAEDTLDELKRSRIQKLKISGSPGADGKISAELPNFLLDILRGALKYGRAKLSYFTDADDGKDVSGRKTYDSETMPMKFAKRKGSEEDDESFAQRCVEDLRLAVAEITPLKNVTEVEE